MSVLHVESEQVAEYKRLILEMRDRMNANPEVDPDPDDAIGSQLDTLWDAISRAGDLPAIRRWLIQLSEDEDKKAEAGAA